MRMRGALVVSFLAICLSACAGTVSDFVQGIEYPSDSTGSKDYSNIWALWHFDDASWTAANSVLDSSPSVFHGTATNGASLTTGRFNTAALFDGTNDYIEIGTTALETIDRTDSFSISVWVKPTASAGGLRCVFCKIANDTTFRGIGLFMNSCTTSCQVFVVIRSDNATTNDIQIGGNTRRPVAGSWNHVVITYNGSSSSTGVKIYVNGVAETSFSTTSNNLTGTIKTSARAMIGARRNATSAFYNGSIDELVIYNKVLSQDEITLLSTMAP